MVPKPLVSVVTPVYNESLYIAEAAASVLNQTCRDWEWIIIDDGSDDGTGDIIGRHNDSRIRYFQQQRAGMDRICDTLNKALALARGNFIALLDGDDFWPYDKIERQIPCFEDHEVVLSYGECRLVDMPVSVAMRHLFGDEGGSILLLGDESTSGPIREAEARFQFAFDLSLENRRATKNQVVKDAAAAMLQTGLGMKAATITPTEANDVGSPNAILREEIDGTVILRTGRRLPRVSPVGGVHDPISIVRMAVDDAYGAKEWREKTPDGDEIAYRTSEISRNTCRAVADFAFQLAQRTGARVFGGPKFTVSPIYEGMFKEELDAAAERHPGVAYEPLLIDATLALLM